MKGMIPPYAMDEETNSSSSHAFNSSLDITQKEKKQNKNKTRLCCCGFDDQFLLKANQNR